MWVYVQRTRRFFRPREPRPRVDLSALRRMSDHRSVRGVGVEDEADALGMGRELDEAFIACFSRVFQTSQEDL